MSDNDENPDSTVRGTSLLHLKLSNVFPEWSSNRIARWLGINPRTLQRMLSNTGPRTADVPEGLYGKITAMGTRVQTFELGSRLDELVGAAQKYEIDDEVIGAWLAHKYKQVMDRDID